MSLPAALRALVLLLLGVSLALPGLWRDRTSAPRVAWLDDARDLERAGDSLLVGRAPPAIARSGSAPPTARELDLLAAAARRAPLFAALPRETASVEADAPARALSGRAAAVAFRVRGAANDSVLVRLGDDTGVLDSVRVRTDRAGNAAGAFRVRPPRPGWRQWTVDAAGRRAHTGAWVDSAGAPRVLVRAGMPHWESKFAVRALEESGAVVETAYDLGRGMFVAQGGAAISPERLARFDAVVVLDAAPLGDAERRTLADWAARAGGGVLLAGGQAGAAAFGLAGDLAAGRAVDGPALAWSLPAELAPLPGDRVRSAAAPFRSVRTGVSVAANSGAGGVLALRPLGRGRAAALAMTETWRWRMEAGRVAEHREFWRALVDWLASAPRAALTVRVPEPVGAVGIRRDVLVYDARPDRAAPAPPLVVTRPGGASDTLPVIPDDHRPGILRASFVPAAAGLHTLAFAGQPPSAAFNATTSADTTADAWARLSLLASQSGGGMVAPDSLRPRVSALGATGAAPLSGRRLGWILFFALLSVAGAEWAVRRLRGAA
ncbi:MAG TPA: hypothetical protein VFQ45_01675 [Longimicrobium sp.]|nr:hypothetical protein [Longimicrobium sp.]